MRTAAVCIATYQRPEGLLKLLRSLADQPTPEGWNVEVRVVNNDPTSFHPAWIAAAEDALPGVVLTCESTRNIAVARNTAIAMGPADAFLFIDDDEVPCAGWLAALLARIEDADAVFGPVIGRVPPSTSRWLVGSGAFDKPGPDHDGRISWKYSRTSSTAVRAEWIGRADRWFSPEYGTSGGSDAEFFKRIEASGARLVHERRALVYEDVEQSRCSWQAVMRRRYKAGAVFGRMDRQPSQALRHLHLAKRVAVGAVITMAGIPLLLIGRPALSFRGACRIAIGIGAWRGHNRTFQVTRYPDKRGAQSTQTEGPLCASPC